VRQRGAYEPISVGLRDNVKDLLLFMPDLQTLNKTISQAVKCDNRLF
jgi:hypothetical protein